MCWSLIFDKVEHWKNFQNSQENTCRRVPSSIKLQAEQICKTRKKTPAPVSRFK